MLRSNTHLMQRVSECKLVVFCGAAAVRARPLSLYIKRALAPKWYDTKFSVEGFPNDKRDILSAPAL